ncbi:LLM class flavin-dependent oxidoreductase [Nocardioides sp. CER19]|uniref:LLM class flavin-dependent oxidoreductase n=1 Tax=Nocardioides sp. CER19 TaxID=3038538 RepID=UPI00244D2224|nr:LLM class flavin-dependent oxidoreductase [Nocardioides sp. CER19]MDH2415238.1 LLM class flavin-dependent oxidoreductase [Nocardioides sp. CER19]
MLIGVNAPHFGPGGDPGLLRDWARLVEDLGFDSLMVSDHVVVTDDFADRYPEPFYDPLTTIAWLSGLTERIRLGTSVLILPYRSALLVARMTANLREISGDRFVLGVGVGWSEPEFDALGISFGDRAALTDRALSTIQETWTQLLGGDRSAIPVWVGGNGARALRRCQRFGAAWHPLRASLGELAAAHRMSGIAEVNPRISLQVSETPLHEEHRGLGIGSIEQIIEDLDRLRRLGAGTVILDPYTGNPEDLHHPEHAWRALTAIATQWKERNLAHI